MIKRVGLWLVACLVICSSAHAQSDGKIKGKVTDEAGSPVEFATVVIILNGVIKGGANTNERGEFSIAPVSPGTYDVRASFAGNTINATGVTVAANKTVPVDLTLETGVEIAEVQITETIPIDNTTTGGSLSGADITQIGIRNINTLSAIIPGVYQSDDGGSLSMRGGRTNATTYFVDGVKVRGTTGIPQKAVSNLTVITGGVPAEYGDVIGGIVSVTTAAPSYKLSGGGEILSSQFLDPYGFNLFAVNLSGPLISKYDSAMDYNRPLLGFFIAAEGEFQKDSDPANGGITTLRDELRNDFTQTPLTLDETGNFFIQRANFVTDDMFETRKAKDNNQSRTVRVNGRLDFAPNDNMIVKVGGTFTDIENTGWSLSNSVFAPEANQLFRGTQYRGWTRFQQSFESGENSQIQNLYYQIQADYSRWDRQFMHSTHRDNIFDYGYIGQFDLDWVPTYRYVDPLDEDHVNTISSAGYYITSSFSPENLAFDATNSKNPDMANYNNFIFDYVESNGIVNPFTGRLENSIPNLDFLVFYGGLRNGDSPRSIYSLFSGPGAEQGGYSKYRFEQYRLTGQASGEIKGHNLKVGFEFEQRQERFYGVAARNLWNYARQLTNRHLQGISQDVSSWELVTQNGYFLDTVNAPPAYEAGDQAGFDRVLREQLGLSVDGLDLINIDALSPNDLNLNMFTADELLNDGNLLVNYYGYDFKGNPTSRRPSEDFFTDEVNRPMNSFAPTYISGFIQDKFELEDIIFNVGVRIDRFDANQSVLKDEYVLFPTYTAAESHALLGIPKPEVIPDNWVPYMDDETSPTAFLGYRDPETDIWYDASGSPTSSASIRSGGEVQPHIKDDEVSIQSFEDYTPQTVIMPRLSFSFPISGEAVFFAHYDVLTQRPGQLSGDQSSALAGQITDYYFLQNSATVQVTNPNLAPEKTIDYEVGFKQKLTDYMALSISTFYREMRDMLQSRNFQDAYPTPYSSFDNIDFGTVKGFTFAINMLRKKNLRMQASYTLQFANGTGSSFTSARNALNSVEGFTAIRALLPLDFDQRHRISGNIDYRFYGKEKGPALNIGEKTIYPLSDAGANLTFYLGSGTPYSVNTLPNAADVQSGINQSIQLGGTPNGSRLPPQVRFDFKVDKSFILGGKTRTDDGGNIVKDSKGNEVVSRAFDFNVYLLLLNALNTKNVLNVYKTSGLADDDGYLSTGVGQQQVAAAIDPASFTYLYTVKMRNPNNFSLPRRIRLGIQFSF